MPSGLDHVPAGVWVVLLVAWLAAWLAATVWGVVWLWTRSPYTVTVRVVVTVLGVFAPFVFAAVWLATLLLLRVRRGRTPSSALTQV